MLIDSRETPLDWLTLIDDTETAYACLQALLRTGEASVDLRPRSGEERRLWHCFNEQRATLRLEGRNVLYFTYPYVMEAAGGEWQATSLLRWTCILEPPVSGREHWRMRTTGAPAELNYAFLAGLPDQEEYDWANLLEQVLAPGPDTPARLGDFARLLSENTVYACSSTRPALARMPRADTSALTATPELWWSAGLVLDKTAWTGAGDLPKYWHQPITHEASTVGNAPLSRLGPSGYAFVRELYGQRYVLAEGRPDAGLNVTSLELAKLALTRGRSCLIVARKLAVLEQLGALLEEAKIPKPYVLTWRNERTDLPIVKGLIGAPEDVPVAGFDPLRRRTALSRSNRLQNRYDAWYDASRQAVFGRHSWSDLLGFYLHYARVEGKELLTGQLNGAHFAFVPREFHEIDAAIRSTRPLYRVLGTLHHPLNNLNSAIFIHQELEESRSFIQTTGETFSRRAYELHQRFVRGQSRYADELTARREESYLRLRTLLDVLEQRHEDGRSLYGEDTLRSGDRTLKLYGRFSKKYARALAEKSSLQQLYDELHEVHHRLDVFSYEWPAPRPKRIVDGLDDFVRSYREALDGWRGQLFQGVQAEMARLNAKTVESTLAAGAGIERLESDLETFVDELNGSGLYQLPLQSKTLTTHRQQKYLEEIIDQLERTDEGLLRYEAFYHWQRNWFSLSEISRKTIQALLRARPDDWEAAFASWYFNECLQRHYTPFSAWSPTQEDKYMEEVEGVRSGLPGFLYDEWAVRRERAYQRLRELSRTDPADLAELTAAYGEQLANYFPVSFATPETAAHLVDHYDLVVLENAEELTLRQAAPVITAARQLAVIAHAEEDYLGEAGVVDFLKRGGIPTVHCADTVVPNLADRWTSRRPRVYFHQVDGRFSEAERTNEVEAGELLKLLNSVEKQGLKRFPKVGVVTLTREQRDHIQYALYRIKKNRSAGAELVQQLERNGLTVLYAGDASGQHFEVVFFSAVYGPVDHKGHLTRRLPELNDPRALAGLRNATDLLERAATVHVLNSLPTDELEARQAWTDRPGERLHAGIVGLAHAYAREDYANLDYLRRHWPTTAAPQDVVDALPRELIYRLRDQLPGWNWRFTHVADLRQKVIVAKSPDSIHVMLLPDGFIARARATTLDWEKWQRDRLRLSGYQVLAFSSEELWKNPTLTCHRLVGQLRNLAFGREEE